jgi:hypothetical protein
VIGKGNEAPVNIFAGRRTVNRAGTVEYFRFRDEKVEAIECYFGAKLGFPSAASTGQR